VCFSRGLATNAGTLFICDLLSECPGLRRATWVLSSPAKRRMRRDVGTRHLAPSHAGEIRLPPVVRLVQQDGDDLVGGLFVIDAFARGREAFPDDIAVARLIASSGGSASALRLTMTRAADRRPDATG
jgi:hypothetical protein